MADRERPLTLDPRIELVRRWYREHAGWNAFITDVSIRLLLAELDEAANAR